MSEYYVTRQIQYPDGDKVVEISGGGLDYVNPGCLIEKYPGEFKGYLDPRDAVEAAINIAQLWQADKPEEEIGIGYGCTFGFTMAFDGEPLNDDSFAELRSWAAKIWDGMPKCDGCENPLPGERERWRAEHWSGLEYCSERCAERAVEHNAEFDAEQEDLDEADDDS